MEQDREEKGGGRGFFFFLPEKSRERNNKLECLCRLERLFLDNIAAYRWKHVRVFYLDNLFLENKLSEGGLTHYEKPINVKQ